MKRAEWRARREARSIVKLLQVGTLASYFSAGRIPMRLFFELHPDGDPLPGRNYGLEDLARLSKHEKFDTGLGKYKEKLNSSCSQKSNADFLAQFQAVTTYRNFLLQMRRQAIAAARFDAAQRHKGRAA